jgi:CDP-diacylglycerol--glycerol-3-phosphate 3-phosphatidyltransferase
MWALAVLSLLTLAQRLHSVRVSPGAMDPLPTAGATVPDDTTEGES